MGSNVTTACTFFLPLRPKKLRPLSTFVEQPGLQLSQKPRKRHSWRFRCSFGLGFWNAQKQHTHVYSSNFPNLKFAREMHYETKSLLLLFFFFSDWIINNPRLTFAFLITWRREMALSLSAGIQLVSFWRRNPMQKSWERGLIHKVGYRKVFNCEQVQLFEQQIS